MSGGQSWRRSPWFRLQVIFYVLLLCTFIATVILLAAMDQIPRTFPERNRAQTAVESGLDVLEHDAESGRIRPWLLFAIPSIERRSDELNPTLDRILEQMPSRNGPHISVLVVKNSEVHPDFDSAQDRFRQRPEFLFIENTNRPKGTAPPGADLGDDRHPSWNVQRHSRDLVFMMDFAVSHISPEYFLFMEDDFSLCPDGLNAIVHLIEKANTHYLDWIGLLFGEGMNGIILKRRDLKEFTSYLNEHLARRPPDHLIVEWLAGETEQSATYRQNRSVVTFRYNLLQHRGADSTLRKFKMFITDTCYHVNDNRRLFEVVSFKPDECGHDDIWPCPQLGSSKVWTPPFT